MELRSAPISYTISPAVPPDLSLSPLQFLASRPHIEHLMAGALVFRNDPCSSVPKLQTLLIRRSASDSYALKWEKPAGCLSSVDSTVLSCAVRELWEETGLRASQIRCPVGMLNVSENVLEGWGIEPEIEQAEIQAEDNAAAVLIWEAGKRWGIITVIVDVEENVSDDGVDGKTVVKISPEEHNEWAWVTEEEVRNGRDKDRKRMEYTSEAVWRTVLEGFRIKRNMNAISQLG